MNKDTLGIIIPSAKGRKLAYAIYAVASLVVTNITVAFASINVANPAWLTISLAVIGNLATVFGTVAIANVGTTSKNKEVMPAPPLSQNIEAVPATSTVTSAEPSIEDLI